MSQTCPNCGFANRAANRFCSNCGVAIVPASQSDDAATASSTQASSANTEPVTYIVQTWDAPDAALTPPTPATEPAAAIPPSPAFVPYGGYASTSPAMSYGTS